MNITFVLACPVLGGGVKVVFQLAESARRMGHRVEVVAEGPRPFWTERLFKGPYRDITTQSESTSLPADLAIATYFTTMEAAEAIGAAKTVHFCQGYEGDLDHLAKEKGVIEAAYRRPWEMLTVNPALGRRMKHTFGKTWHFVPPPLDPIFRPRWRVGPQRIPVLAIPGIFEAPVKGLRQALESVRLLRLKGWHLKVVRFSTLPLSEEESALHQPDHYFCGISPEQVASELRNCDLMLMGSSWGEGFGLPALESAASGVPVVVNNLPAMRMVGVPQTARVNVGDAIGMATAAHRILQDRQEWRRSRATLLRRTRARFHQQAIDRRMKTFLEHFTP